MRVLCETVLARTPNTDVADFVADQLPAPRSALALACVMQLTYTDDGARFWWQYAAGAGQSAAAYCLYLHHLANGEEDLAQWWHQQTDATATPAPTDDEPLPDTDPEPEEWAPATYPLSTSPTTMLRVLRQLARSSSRARTLNRLMTYLSTAVDVGYLRHDFEIPLPGPDFAHRITTLVHDAPGGPAVRGECSRRRSGGLPRRHDAPVPAGQNLPAPADH
ncbi:hypothetical protein [Streptomyces sp. B93]|uniref:hypothetical protein n=1 Tax=Streptomyces sp. B93 TaxID=2824875 RepID=UPI001B3722C5|nr:hypothetical protein [Streptomyces sp. B93]MBQ1093395.1 hypothetical protein [Streptomyces sp. B93]